MPYSTRDQLSTQDLILEVENVLTMVDVNLEALKLQNETYLRAEWAIKLIKTLVGNRPFSVTTGFQRRSDSRFVAMLLSDGTVSVWETERYEMDRHLGIITAETTERYEMDRHLGIITAETTMRDVWRMRQQQVWIRAAEQNMLLPK